MRRTLAATSLVLVLFITPTTAQQNSITADSVKAEFLHAWNAYKQYAWGHDAVRPLSKEPRDWYASPLLMTPLDGFDTMVLMGLKGEAAEAKKLVLDSLSFDRDMEIQVFEITIRLLGGLLSSYQLDGDKRFLALAEDLGTRMLPCFESPTGMPYRFVNLRTGKTRGPVSNPAEIGTLVIEFGTLSKLTGNPVFYQKAKLASVQLFNRRSKIGLVGAGINVESGEWTNKSSHLGGGIDSYYEYLLKAWLLFGDKDFKTMWDESIKAINTYIADTTHQGLWYGRVDMDTGKQTETLWGSLEAFFPAVLCLAGDIDRARKLEESCYTMWNAEGIECEGFDYATMKPTYKSYHLGPEIIESAYYLYHYTGDQRYRTMGETFYRSLVKYCRTDAGYASLGDVITKEKKDELESFFFAETMKYLYLLFAPPETLDLDSVIFNTEAHPIRRTW